MDYTFPNTLASTKPKFFVQGEADEVCPLEGMWKFYGRLEEPKELVVIDAADHLFDGKTQEVGEALEDLLGDFADGRHSHERSSHRLARSGRQSARRPAGALRYTRPDDMAAVVIEAALGRAPGLDRGGGRGRDHRAARCRRPNRG